MNGRDSFTRRASSLVLIALLVFCGMLSNTAAAAAPDAAPTAHVFYTATVDAYKSWVASTTTTPPAQTAMFPPGTTLVAFYFAYANATVNATKFQLAVYDASGKLYAYDARFTGRYVNGMFMKKLAPHRGTTYAAGSYSARLFIQDREALRTTFTVAAPEPAWLAEINRYRRAAGVAPLTNQPAWNLGLQHHIRYLANTPARYRTGDYASPHTENPASPYYTKDGEAVEDSNLVSDYVKYTDVYVIDVWLTAPFHGQVMLDPRLRSVAFAYDPAAGIGGLDVWDGYDFALSRTTKPIFLPAPGMTTNLTHMLSTEAPDPLLTCGWQDRKAGLPLIVRLAQPPSQSLRASISGSSGLRESSGSGTFCVVDDTTFKAADAAEQTANRRDMRNEKLVFLIPAQPLTGGTYTVRISQPGQAELQWSFQVKTQ